MNHIVFFLSTHRHRFLTVVLAVCVTITWLSECFSDTIVFDNITINGPTYSVSTDGPLYNSFTIQGGDNIFLTTLQLALYYNSDLDPNGSASIGLFSDSSASPGSLIRTLASQPDLSHLTPFIYTYGFDPVGLVAGTRYWIGIWTDTTSNVRWILNPFPTVWPNEPAIGVYGEYFADSNGVFSSTNGNFQMTLLASGNGIVVPEVGVSGLLSTLAVLVSFAGLLERARKK